MTSTVVYQGDLRTLNTHLQSSSKLETDAPTDNNGKGERFSPTDLLATSLANCMLTTMGIRARNLNIDLKGIKVEVLSSDQEKNFDLEKIKEVDEKLIKIAKNEKGKIITCDFNLEKKASISGVTTININTLANLLKVRAIPGEVFSIKLVHKGKDSTQGVGYFDDGTMVVVENASFDIGKAVEVKVSRVIQTTAGRILFAKKVL